MKYSKEAPQLEVDDKTNMLDTISNLTNDQINSYIDQNVVDLASAKVFLKKLAKVVATLARKANQ